VISAVTFESELPVSVKGGMRKCQKERGIVHDSELLVLEEFNMLLCLIVVLGCTSLCEGWNAEMSEREDIELISLGNRQADQERKRQAEDWKDWKLIQYHKPGPDKKFEKSDWEQYVHGWGSPYNETEYWFGLKYLNKVTSEGNMDVLFVFNNHSVGAATFVCHNFTVASEPHYYRLGMKDCGKTKAPHVWYTNIARNFGWLDQAPFSTTDKDHDAHHDNCAHINFGGFWYKQPCIEQYYPPTGDKWMEAKIALRKL